MTPRAATRHVHHAYGLRIATPFACPELARDDQPDGAPDVVVRFGDVPSRIVRATVRGPTCEATADALLLDIPRIGRFLVQHGREIVIERAEGVRIDALRTFVLGSCIAATLQQRGVLTLNASSVCMPNGEVVLLLGSPGSGKSTLAAALVQRGAELVGDDIAAITMDPNGAPIVHAADTQIKLWADVVARFADGADGAAPLRRVRVGYDRFALPVPHVTANALPVHRAYVVATSSEAGWRTEPLHPLERFRLLTRHTYRRYFLDPTVRRLEHFRLVTMTASRLPVTTMTRSNRSFVLDEMADRIVADATGDATGAATGTVTVGMP